MKTDSQLQKDVMAELEWEPSVDQADIGVAVIDGVVTLNGFVKTYAEKIAAEKAARRVAGVKAIAQELKVRIPSASKTADHEIAKRILDIFAWNSTVPADKIQVKVQEGWVTLSGEVNWRFQSNEAVRLASQISGVIDVINMIKIAAQPSPADVRQRIEQAFQRQADLDAMAVKVSVDGHKVTLDGCVNAWHERRAAERAAWAAPGVSQVVDRITVY
jgi:osmotically-inducible protein OsmY